MRVAQELFYTKGYEDTSVNDIIKMAGVSKGAFYHHFDSKLTILESISTQLMNEAVKDLEAIVADDLLAIAKWQKVVHLSHTWQMKKEPAVSEIGRILRSDKNVILHHKLNASWLKVSTPEITKIIIQGVFEGVFNVEYASETAVILVRLIDHLNEELDNLVTNTKEVDTLNMLITQKLAAAQSIVEHLLGAPTGSIPMVENQF